MSKFFTFAIIMTIAYIADSILQTIPHGTGIAWVIILTYILYHMIKKFQESNQ